MASLSSLKVDLAPASNPGITSFTISNDSRSQNNGGRCCLWTVPDGVTQVTFELWGSGPNGAAARCCQATVFTGSGGMYAMRTISTVAGCTYTLCAAGSGCCSSSCNGSTGATTYVSGSGIATTCAPSGEPGRTSCFTLDGATCCAGCVVCKTSAGEWCMPGIRNTTHKEGGCLNTNKWVMGGAYQLGTFNATRSLCLNTTYCNACCWGYGHFPAGPGSNAITCSGVCRCGTPGMGGVIRVSFA